MLLKAAQHDTRELETELASVSFVLGKRVAGHEELHASLAQYDQSLSKRSPIVDEITFLLERDAVQECLKSVDEWHFDMFAFDQATMGKPLQVISEQRYV